MKTPHWDALRKEWENDHCFGSATYHLIRRAVEAVLADVAELASQRQSETRARLVSRFVGAVEDAAANHQQSGAHALAYALADYLAVEGVEQLQPEPQPAPAPDAVAVTTAMEDVQRYRTSDNYGEVEMVGSDTGAWVWRNDAFAASFIDQRTAVDRATREQAKRIAALEAEVRQWQEKSDRHEAERDSFRSLADANAAAARELVELRELAASVVVNPINRCGEYVELEKYDRLRSLLGLDGKGVG